MENEPAKHDDGVEMPAPTVWPMVLSLGIVLLAAGVATTLVLSVLGFIIFVVGLTGWVAQLLPGKGHVHEPRAEARPEMVKGVPGTVDHLRVGQPGYRFRLPEKVHPISAGLKGGLVGGLLMPIPAFAYGILSGHGIWFPINLLSGMVLPGVEEMNTDALEKFHLSLLLMGIVIHAVISAVIGLMYGVLLPTVPQSRGGAIVFGGLVMPALWTGLSYGLMGVLNSKLQENVHWPSFIAAQFVFGVAAALVVIRSEKIAAEPVGGGEAVAEGKLE